MPNLYLEVHRENGYDVLRENCADLVIGPEGLKTCMWTSLLCVVAWPVSPGLGLYTMIQRNYLRLIYGGLKGRRDTGPVLCSSDGGDMCCSCVCWPYALRQHETFLAAQAEEGLLRFPWEQEYLHAHRRGGPSVDSQVCYILGAPQAGKTLLFERLLGSASGLEVQPVNKIRVGARPYKTTGDSVVFMEFWDVPSLCVDLVMPQSNHAALLVFDSNSERSFDEMTELATAVGERCHNCVVVATKEGVGGDRIGARAVLYSKAQYWAATKGWQFYGLDVTDNPSVSKLGRLAQAMFQ